MNTPSPTPQEKYLEKPFAGSSHTWAINHCRKWATTDRSFLNRRVLDIGPGSGIMGKELAELGYSDRCAVEIDPDARAHVAPHYRSIYETLSEAGPDPYGLILLLDVLEHVSDPYSFFADICGRLAVHGKLLVSVPNIAHWSTRFSLLFGFFEYTDRGIIDRTHLQFFTRRRFQKLLTSISGVSTIEQASSIEPAQFILPRWVWDNGVYRTLADFHLSLAQILPGLLGYQHLAVLEKHG